MRRRLAVVAVLVLSSLLASAQEIRRFEVGLQTTMLRTLGETRSCGGCPVGQWSLGPAVTLNLNRTFAIDGDLSFFPAESKSSDNFRGGRLTEALAGLKASIRNGRWTMFAKVRPGEVSWSHAVTHVTVVPGAVPPFAFDFGRKNYFALDLGGGVETAVSKRVSARFQMSDTRIRFAPGFTRDNLQITTGVYYQTGVVLQADAQRLDPDTHRFIDRTNVAIWTTSLLAQTADALLTQRHHAICLRNPPFGDRSVCSETEANPLARPFVNQGWAGEVGLAAIVNGSEWTVQYIIHRWGHHRVERFLLAPQIMGNALGAYANARAN